MKLNRIVSAAIGCALVVTTTLSGTASARGPSARVDCASMEGCYKYDEMDQFLSEAWRLVLDFSEDRYQPRLFGVVLRYVAHGDTGDEGCHAKYTPRSYEYCPADNTIYIGQDQLWQFYSQMGDAAAVVGLAHEFGHALQQAHDVPAPRTPAQSVAHENQADCVAGAWFGYAEKHDLVEPDDLHDLTQLLDFIGSSEDDPERDHGTTAERARSLTLGRTGGIDACNRLSRDTPIRPAGEQSEYTHLMARLRKDDAWVHTSPTNGRRELRGRADGAAGY